MTDTRDPVERTAKLNDTDDIRRRAEYLHPGQSEMKVGAAWVLNIITERDTYRENLERVQAHLRWYAERYGPEEAR